MSAFRAATAVLRQVSATTSAHSIAGPSSLAAPSTSFSRLARLQGYATQAGQPMPPPPSEEDLSKSKSDSPAEPTNSKESSPSEASGPAAGIEASIASESPVSSTNGKEIKPVSSLASQYLDMTEIPASPAERTGARSTSGKRPLSSIEKKRRNMGRAALAALTIGGGLAAWELGRPWDSEKEKERLGKDVLEEAGLLGRWQRGQARFWDTLDYFNKPAFDPLLPEMLPPPHQKPYTLLLSLDDLMIHSSWDRVHGWRTAKRPGLDYFLAYLSQFYEIVLFTSQPTYTAIPIVEKLDPHGIYILYKLFKDATRYYNKENVKDLSYLGRDLKKVILLDTDPNHFMLQPENAIQMPKWNGDKNDRDLVGMIPFLEAIAYFGIQDVRPLLTNYKGKHIPSAWAEFEAQQKKQLTEEWEAQNSKKKGKLGGFGGLFGMGGSQAQQEVGPPKTPLERFREQCQQSYLEEQKFWADNKAAIEKQMEEERELQKKQMNSSVFNFIATNFGLAPPPGEAPGVLGGNSGQSSAGASQK